MSKIFCDEWRPLKRNEEQVSTLGMQDAKGEIERMVMELITQEDMDIEPIIQEGMEDAEGAVEAEASHRRA